MKTILQRTLSALVCLVMITSSLPAVSEMIPSATLEIIEETTATPAPEITAEPTAEPEIAPETDPAPQPETTAAPEEEVEAQVITMQQAFTALTGEAENSEIAGFTYTIQDGEAAITGCSVSEAILSVPETLEGVPVTAIADYAFSGCADLVEILLPAGIKSIGSHAFSDCTGLQRITLPDAAIIIGDYAFSGCTALKSLLLPFDASIGEGAFEGCTALSLEIYAESAADSYCAEQSIPFSYRALIRPTKITPERAKFIIGLNETVSLAGYTLEPAGAQADVSYTSKSKSIASVTADGLVTGKKAAKATDVVLKTDNGEKCTARVIVKKAPTSIKLTAERSILGVGEQLQLTAKLSSGSASYSIDYISSDETIAAVDAAGMLTALKPGKVFITAVTYNGKTTQTPLEIEIREAPKSIALDKSEITLARKDSYSLAATLSDGSAGAVTYSTSDKAIATVSASGKITAGSTKGTAIITATTYNGKSAQCTVTVTHGPSSISIIADRKTMSAGEEMQLSTVLKADGAAATIKFKSSKSSVASVDANGLVTAHKAGSATITATTHNGKKASIKITVKKAPTSVTLVAERYALGLGETTQLSYKLSSGSAGTVRYTVSDESVLSVSEDGLLTPITLGKAKITATAYNGVSSEPIEVEILPDPEFITLDKSEITLARNDSYTLSHTLSEGSASAIAYESSDKSIAKVSASGKITAGTTKGTAIITASAYNGVSAQCIVTVTHGPSSISISADRKTIGAGETLQLRTALKAEGAAATLKFKSSKTSVATVDANGLVTAHKAGTATITVTTHNSKKASIKITVKKAPESVTVVAPKTQLGQGETMQLSYKLSSGSVGTAIYASLTPEIAAITPDGMVTALAPGKASFTAAAHNGVVSEACTVEILPAPEKILLDSASFLLAEGETAVLHAQVNEGSTGEITYHSENPEIAKIDSASGKITAVSAGKTRLYATTYVEGLAAWADIEVKPVPSYVSLDISEISLGVGDTLQLQPRYDEGAHTSLSYSSKYAKYASVDANGLVTALTAGETTITVKTHNGKSCKLVVTVKKAPSSITPLPAAITLGLGESSTLSYKLSSGSAASVRFESLKENIASVDANGLVTAHATGTAEIRLTTHNGVSAVSTVTVVPAPKKITLDLPDELGVKLSTAAAVSLQPENAASAIAYSVVSQKPAAQSSNSSIPVVTIDENGTITGLNPGTAVIRASTYLKGVYADHTIAVLPAPTKVAFAQQEYIVSVEETLQLMPLVNEGSWTQFTYKAKKNDFFTIDENGLVTPIMRGTTTVTVTTHNGLTATATITVMDPYYPEDMYLANDAPEYMESKDTFTPKVTTVPATALPAISWTSSDTDIITVNEETGKITAVSYGRAVITGISTRNPSLQISYQVVVLDDERCLTMPATRTNTSKINATLNQIRSVRASAYNELEALYVKGVITQKDYEKRRTAITRAFDMHLFPWMTETKELYWKAANSEDGAKDYKPGIVYYGLPYTQTNRNFNVDKALDKDYFVSSGKGYYLMQGEKFASRYYPGNDCSSFASMAIHGTNSDYSYLNTRSIASSAVYRTLSNWEDLRPGDLLNKGGSHVVMFLYWANEAKTQMVIIEQGGSASADRGIDNLAYSNTVACSIKNVSYYTSRSYKIRRLASLGY